MLLETLVESVYSFAGRDIAFYGSFGRLHGYFHAGDRWVRLRVFLFRFLYHDLINLLKF